MFRDLLSSRLIQAGLVFFVVVVGGSLLYSWHARRATARDMQRHDRLLQRPQKQSETRLAGTVKVPTESVARSFVDTPDENTDTPMSAKTAALENNIETLDIVNTFLPEDASESSEEEPIETPYGVSPFGFGPFPEIPSDYPDQETWSAERLQTMQPDHELLSRVRIKLWNQGVHTVGATYDSEYRLIYPIIDDVVYYEEKFGADGSVTRRALTSPVTSDKYGADLFEGIIAPHLTVYEFPDGGIDPYEFLNLPR